MSTQKRISLRDLVSLSNRIRLGDIFSQTKKKLVRETSLSERKNGLGRLVSKAPTSVWERVEVCLLASVY